MIIPINLPSSSYSSFRTPLPPTLAKISHSEIVLIELQGKLEVECNHPSERDGRLVGKLTVDEATSKPTLMIGHHLLEGKIMTLPKPLGVLVRSGRRKGGASGYPVPHDVDSDCDLDMNVADDLEPQSGAEANASEDSETVGWDIVAIVKRKIVFGKRPMPVIGKHI